MQHRKPLGFSPLHWILLIILALMLFGCGSSDGSGEKKDGLLSETYVEFNGEIRTVRHDGHKFVIYRTGTGAGVIHHPACCTGSH